MSTPPPIPPLAKKVVVEPLSEDRLTRIERNIVSRAVETRPARLQALTRWLSVTVAVGATALVAGVFGWFAHGRVAHHATAQLASGPVSVHTEATAGSTIDIGDATIASGPNTAFAVTRPDGGVLVDMSRGRIELEVAKRGARPPLVVHAGDTDVIVVGTHFVVDFGDGSSDVDVRVQEGRVKIVRHSHELVVGAGQEWTSRGGDTVVAIAPGTGGTPGTAGTPTGDVPAGPDDTATPATGNTGHAPAGTGGTVPTAPGFVVHVGTAPTVLHSHVAAVPDPHKPHPTPAVKTPTPATPETAPQPGSTECTKVVNGAIVSCAEAQREAEQKANPSLEVLAAIRNVALPKLLDVDGIQDPATLKTRYRDAALGTTGTSAERSKALYSLAQLQATRLFRTDDALNTIDEYLRRFVRGAETRDVLWLRVYILCSRSIRSNKTINSDCREAAQIYEDKAPDGPGEHVAELITATPQ